MITRRHVRPGAYVEFSEEVAVQVDGGFYSAFARNSYIARVVWDEGGSVQIVVLPINARMHGESFWVDTVLKHAKDASSEIVVLT